MSGYKKITFISGVEGGDIGFDNSTSDLISDNLQDAILEVYNKVQGDSSKYQLLFNPEDWDDMGVYLEIEILSTSHLKGKNIFCEVYELTSGNYNLVETHQLIDDNGNIKLHIESGNSFQGKVTII